MAREVREYAATIPTGTTPASPHAMTLAMPPRVVTRIVVRVPPGPRGVMGFAIGSAGVAVIPVNPGQWIVTDDATLPFDLDDYIDSGTWEFFGYNTGTFAHTVYLTFHCTLPGSSAPSSPQPTVAAVISSGGFGAPGTGGALPALPTLPTPPALPTLPTPPAIPTPPALPTLPTPPAIPTPPATLTPTAPPTAPTAPATAPATPPPTATPPAPPPLGQWVVAPTSTVRHFGAHTYSPISTYAGSLVLAETPGVVYLWTRTQDSPSLPQTPASLAAWEHGGNHAFTQYTTYQKS